MNHFARLFGGKFCVLFKVQQSGNLKKNLWRCVVVVHGYGLGEQIQFFSNPNLDICINKFGGGRWKTEDPAWRTGSSSDT